MAHIAHPANRLGLDYRAEAQRLGPPIVSITDSHLHINGTTAAELFREVAQLFGVQRFYSMSQLENVPHLQELFGDTIRFTAVPNYSAEDLLTAFTTDWLARIEGFAELGCRLCKFWAAPRARDYARELGVPDLFEFDHPQRRQAMRLARDCGMMFLTHIADPDTWFAGKYADSATYGTKRQQYEQFERALDEFDDVRWIAAHMGGWPEDLEFLDGLLARHPHLYLDTAATKWMVRELSRHSRDDLVAFLGRWKGRVLFGSDVVTSDDHLVPDTEPTDGPGSAASSRSEAFDLYASRYYALRTLFETDHEGESPIADPDLAMVDPDKHDEFSAPLLRGRNLPDDILRSLYHDAAAAVLDDWHETNRVDPM